MVSFISSLKNWTFFTGNGLDVVSEQVGFFTFKCDDSKFEVLPEVLLEYGYHTTVKVTTNGTKTWIKIPIDRNDMIFGMGEQFTNWNLKGNMYRNVPREDGIFRHGIISTAIQWNLKAPQQEESASYIISPHFVTSGGNSLVIENLEYAEFDFRNKDFILLKINSPEVVMTLFYHLDLKMHIQWYTSLYGRQPTTLPEYTQNGAIIGAMGGSNRVKGIVSKLKDANVSVSAVWIQDWCGLRFQPILGMKHWRVLWTWQSNDELYSPSVQNFTLYFRDQDIKVLGYINPFMVPQSPFYQEANDLGYFVKFRNKTKMFSQGPGFEGAMIDLMNPDAYEWYDRLVGKQLADFDGYMADFGEYQPFEFTNSTEHNKFIEKWSKFNKRGNKMNFMRSGGLYGKDQVALYWSGDQMHVFDKYDGLQAVLNGYLQASLSGYGIIHSDVGGLTTVAFGFNKLVLGWKRNEDVLLRWMELNVFEAVIRSHEGSLPLANIQVHTNEKTMKYFKVMVDRFVALKVIRQQLFEEYRLTGMGLFRPLYLYFKDCWQINNQFMYGPNIMVAPVMNRKTFKRRVYIPDGAWIHVFSGQEYSKGWMSIDSAYGETPIFIKTSYYGHEDIQPFLRLVNKS